MAVSSRHTNDFDGLSFEDVRKSQDNYVRINQRTIINDSDVDISNVDNSHDKYRFL